MIQAWVVQVDSSTTLLLSCQIGHCHLRMNVATRTKTQPVLHEDVPCYVRNDGG